jgi:hypothetical protein
LIKPTVIAPVEKPVEKFGNDAIKRVTVKIGAATFENGF